MNPFKSRIARAQGGRRGRVPGGGRYSRYSYPNGFDAVPSAQVIDQGTQSPFNAERRLHRQAVNIVIANPSDERLDAVLTAGDHEAEYTGKVLQDGTANYTNDESTAVNSVTVTCDFGISKVGALANFQKLIQRKGVIVSSLRYKFQTDQQLANKAHFRQYDDFGDHGIDFIDFNVDSNPHQFHNKDILTALRFVLNRDTTMQMSVNAGETITLAFYVESVLQIDQVLVQQARVSGGNILL